MQVRPLGRHPVPADQLALFVPLRLACLAVRRASGWLALLAWSDRAKDAEIRAPRTELESAMQKIVPMCRSAWLPRSRMPNLPALAQEKRPGQQHDRISGTHTFPSPDRAIPSAGRSLASSLWAGADYYDRPPDLPALVRVPGWLARMFSAAKLTA
jgi:hypothetical protein